MAEKGLEPEVIKALEHIDKGENFLLSGGAGSGKTYSLVQIIKETIKKNPTAQIACMTYTNAAVKEIEERVNHKNLRVSTIHDFLWDTLKSFQKELKLSVLELINDETSKIKNPTEDSEENYFNEFEEGISYKEYLRIERGEISHDELLIVANYMYEHYKILCDILKDKYKFIFIDEYQDTSPIVIQIFLDHIKKSSKKCVIGFFGDSMQAIYDDGVGDLNSYIENDIVKQVPKVQNRRNPKLVIELANIVRIDGLIQEPSTDNNAPNMENGKVIKGDIKFLYSASSDLNRIKEAEYFSNWDFSSKITKELNLTHNLIASKAGFPELMSIYDKDPIIKFKKDLITKIKKDNINIDENETFSQIIERVPLKDRKKQLKIDLIKTNPHDNTLYEQLKDLPFSIVKKIYLNKDSLIDDKKDDTEDENKKGSKRDNLIKHLFKIQTLVHLYNVNKISEFINKTEYRINSIAKKRELKKIIDKVNGMSDSTIEKVINFADEKGICKIDDKLKSFIEKNEYLFNRVKQVKYKEFQNLFYYLEGYTPFSTQHKIKGAEFDNVFVILDNGKWNDYNFSRLFGDGNGAESVLLRTQKIFYVCCTRAKKNLIVFYHNPSSIVLNRAKEWFGVENVREV